MLLLSMHDMLTDRYLSQLLRQQLIVYIVLPKKLILVPC